MADQIKYIPIDLLVEPWVMLRPVDENSLEYLELLSSVQDSGLLSSIAVRPSPRWEGKYEIIDGMYRFHVVKHLAHEEVPAIIKEGVTDEDVLALQISANAIRPETKRCEFARQLKRIQKLRPDVTIDRLANMVNKDVLWVKKQLLLTQHPMAVQDAIDRGEICASNAYNLNKIPPHLRYSYIDEAKVLSAKEFAVLASSLLKQYQEAIKQGKVEAFFTEDFTPQAHLRSLKHVEREYDHPEAFYEIIARLGTTKKRNALTVWQAALEWALNLDLDSVKKQEDAARGRSRKGRLNIMPRKKTERNE